jgi:hypothetical protein
MTVLLYLSSQGMMCILLEIWDNVHEVKDVPIISTQRNLKRLQGQGTAVEGKSSETSFASMLNFLPSIKLSPL